jgi:cation diffusion facilitator family transporter
MRRPYRSSEGRSLLVVGVAVTADILVTVFRFAVATITGSSTLLAQAFQSTAETANQALLFRGHAGARQEETPRHPFGYARERYFWSFLVALLIFVVGSAAALIEAYLEFRSPQPITRAPWAYAALGLAAVSDGSSLFFARRQARRERAGPMLDYVRESKNPEISVVMLQDTGAVVGVAIATVAVTASLLTNTPALDAAGSAAIGVLLAAVAFALARRMKSLLIGEAASDEETETIGRIILRHRDVRDLISLRTVYHGPGELVVEAQVSFDESLRFRALAQVIDEIEADIRRQVEAARLVAIEPAVPRTRDPDVPAWQRPDGASPQSQRPG